MTTAKKIVKKKTAVYDLQVTEAAIFGGFNFEYLGILFALALKHSYFKENKIKKFSTKSLAQELSMSTRSIQRALKYLREKKLIIKKAGVEYINPLYCYQSGAEVRQNNIEHILNPLPIEKGETKYYFSLVSLPSEEDAENYYL